MVALLMVYSMKYMKIKIINSSFVVLISSREETVVFVSPICLRTFSAYVPNKQLS